MCGRVPVAFALKMRISGAVRSLPAQGFTLLEVMVALAIAATALVILLSRLGASADIQHDVYMHALALETAVDVLARERLSGAVATSEKGGNEQAGETEMSWTVKPEVTAVPGFVRQNVTVSAPGESAVRLFLYREVKQP